MIDIDKNEEKVNEVVRELREMNRSLNALNGTVMIVIIWKTLIWLVALL